jgi:hypothetical protein
MSGVATSVRTQAAPRVRFHLGIDTDNIDAADSNPTTDDNPIRWPPSSSVTAASTNSDCSIGQSGDDRRGRPRLPVSDFEMRSR